MSVCQPAELSYMISIGRNKEERTMLSRGLLLFKAPSPKHLCFSPILPLRRNIGNGFRSCSTTTVSSLQPPDVACLAETARITLTPLEVEEFAPKIQQVVDWFGQLQEVDLTSVEPALRADTEVNGFRNDIPESFGNRDAMIDAVPSYEEPYIKVPKVLNKE